MKRTQKIKEIWKNLPSLPAHAYVPPNVNKDDQSKKKITTGLQKLHEKAKEGLTENTPEGVNFLKQRHLVGLVMRNYCRSLKAIKNKVYLKRVKGLTAVVMGLALNGLDSEDGLGSEASLDSINVTALDAELLKADEPEPAEATDAPAAQAWTTGAVGQKPPEKKAAQPTPVNPQANGSPTNPGGNENRKGPPTRHGTAGPQILAPKELRELSEAAMKQARLKHNCERKEKLAGLSKAGPAFFASSFSAKIAPLERDAGPEFAEVMKSLRACERIDGLTNDNVAKLEADARRYLAHFEKLGAAASFMYASQAKKKACEQILTRTPLAACHLAQKDLGAAEAWGPAQEHQAGAIYAKALFETGDTAAARVQASKVGSGGVNQSWWVEKQGDPNGPKKKFIFKPAELEKELPGFPPGGSACREVLGKAVADKLQALTGLDFRAPETLLVNVAKGRLAGFNDRDPEKPETVGSMQHFTKVGGELADELKRYPDLAKRIPKEECQKMAVLDLVSLNTDRHSGNFLVAGADTASPSLVPIDHGLVLPSRAGLESRFSCLGPPHTALSKFPAAEEPFTPEMAALVAAIDPAEVVKGLAEAQEVMEKQHPDQARKANIGKDNFDLVVRSCQFLKAGVAAGLSPAELFDAHVHYQSAIFDTPPEGAEAAFAKVIQGVRARSPLRMQAMQAMPGGPDDVEPVARDLQALGWDVEVAPKEGGKHMAYQMLLANPALVACRQNKTVNPAFQDEIAGLKAKHQMLGIDPSALPTTANPVELRNKLEDAITDELRNRWLAEKNKLPADERKKLPTGNAADRIRAVYGEFVTEGGAQVLQSAGVDVTGKNIVEILDAYTDQTLNRLRSEGVTASFEKAWPGSLKKNDRHHQAEVLRAWEQYVAEGGDQKYGELGCPKGVTDIPVRLRYLRKAKKLQAALANVQPGAATTTQPRRTEPAPGAQDQAAQEQEATYHELFASVRKKLASATVQQQQKAVRTLQVVNNLKQRQQLGNAVLALRGLMDELKSEPVAAQAHAG
jgi:hypothetical protein